MRLLRSSGQKKKMKSLDEAAPQVPTRSRMRKIQIGRHSRRSRSTSQAVLLDHRVHRLLDIQNHRLRGTALEEIFLRLRHVHHLVLIVKEENWPRRLHRSRETGIALAMLEDVKGQGRLSDDQTMCPAATPESRYMAEFAPVGVCHVWSARQRSARTVTFLQGKQESLHRGAPRISVTSMAPLCMTNGVVRLPVSRLHRRAPSCRLTDHSQLPEQRQHLHHLHQGGMANGLLRDRRRGGRPSDRLGQLIFEFRSAPARHQSRR